VPKTITHTELLCGAREKYRELIHMGHFVASQRNATDPFRRATL